MKIILDTNFLVYCAGQNIDYISEMPVSGDIVVLSAVIEELEKLKKEAKKGKDKEIAELAMKILNKNIEEKKVMVLRTDGPADDAIVKLAEKEDAVATMDKELKERLEGKARILSIRQKKKLVIL